MSLWSIIGTSKYQCEYTNYVYVIIIIFIMPPIIREFQFSGHRYALSWLAHVDGDADGYKLRLSLARSQGAMHLIIL